MGLDIYARWDGITEEERKAQVTGFATSGKVGYLRSAYNSSGFNSWCEKTLGEYGYYFIFDYPRNLDAPEDFAPSWDEAALRTMQLIRKLDALPKDNLYVWKVTSPVDPVGEIPVLTEQNVLEFYRQKERSRMDVPSDVYNYSFYAGDVFSAEPKKVKAVLWITSDSAFSTQPKEPVLIVEGKQDPNTFYREMLLETLDFINFGASKNARLLWSA